ncbi:hypothetical protein ABUZ04_002729 [Escherichia coli]|nr:hypothetical protein [Escherichia coli]EJZ0951456.1 hypothetical protein [Escherichia coli]EKD1119610.1 hypothetical protein [Escherichia coli]HDP5215141.1 hypothetical protein [Escherichia coli]
MVNQTMQQNQYYRILSGESRPFPGIYEAISEQLLLLIFKARQLYQAPEYRPWFEEQHQVLSSLRTNTELRRIFTEQRRIQEPTLALSASTLPQPTNSDLTDALYVMCHLYNGFDEGNISLKSWGAMQEVQTTPNFFSLGPRTWKTPELAKFVGDDLFNILTECKAWSSPIPAEARQGYCHQDLSVAHSCTSELLAHLKQYHEIDESTILAITIGLAVNEFYQNKQNIPEWLSCFENKNKWPWDCRKSDTEDVHRLRERLSIIGCTEFVKNMFSVASQREIQTMYNIYVHIYAAEICGWVKTSMAYFKPTDFIQYTWKFATVTPDKDEKTENTTAWERDYCQITIQRDELLRLIRTNTLQDAAIHLSGCLQYAYLESVKHDIDYPGIAPNAEEKKMKHTDSIEFSGIRNNIINAVKRLESFEKWYETNKVLLVSNKKIRTEKIDVVVRLAGLKAYDLQEGVPDGLKWKVKDGINERIKTDTSLCLPQDISDTSLNRYRHAVTRIVNNEIDTLLMEQKKKNKRFPYSKDRHAIQPLWSKCLIKQ